MTNPFVHTLVFIAAVLIPGGLLVYFAWRAISLKGRPNHTVLKDGIVDISEDPDQVLAAYRRMFPRLPSEALLERARVNRLNLYKTRPRKKSQ
jgi:hypothetical protein